MNGKVTSYIAQLAGSGTVASVGAVVGCSVLLIFGGVALVASVVLNSRTAVILVWGFNTRRTYAQVTGSSSELDDNATAVVLHANPDPQTMSSSDPPVGTGTASAA